MFLLILTENAIALSAQANLSGTVHPTFSHESFALLWSAVTEGTTHNMPSPLPRWKCVLVLLGRGLAVLADAYCGIG